MTSLVAAAAILSGVAGAEDRLSLEKLRDAVCASADANGETHRPYVCDPRCGCAPQQPPSLAEVTECEELPVGVFTARATVTNTPSCSGRCPIITATSCSDLNAQPGGICGAGDVCSSGTCSAQLCGSPICSNVPLPCQTDADCVVLCAFAIQPTPFDPPVDVGFCYDLPCTSEADCAPGYSCQGQTCVSVVSCDEGDPCPTSTTVHQVLRLEGVLPADDPGVVTCIAGELPPSTTEINSNDALECIATIEAAIGQPCTPASP